MNQHGLLPFPLVFGAAAFGLSPASAPAQVRGPIAGLSTEDAYYIHYGDWDSTRIADARDNFQLVILEARSNITRANVANIQSGPDLTADTSDDVIVLGYVSVGEDVRPIIFDGFGEIMPVPSGTGPRIDPRAMGESIASTVGVGGVPSLGLPSPAGTGYASFYLDQTPYDGLPDRNSTFGGAYVNAGDPAWYTIIRTMTIGVEGLAGLDELLTTTVGKGLGCDGIFMDTLETPAPNSFGATEFEWTAPGFQTLVRDIATDYPDAHLLANRGLFFFSPNFEHYQFTLRPYIDLVMFESYYTDSNTSDVITPFFSDNKLNLAPKINAEAGRADGFTVVALGYDEPPALPPGIVAQDYIESQREQGWLLYRTNAGLNAAMNFGPQTWIASNPDTAPPVWDSTILGFAAMGDPAPTPRTGIQEAVAGDGEVTVRWDVARDQTQPVVYNIYYTAAASPGPIGGVDWMLLPALTGTAPSNYAQGAGAGRYANEYTVGGLTNGVEYTFAVRAQDAATAPHEETNSVTLAAMPVSPDIFHRTIVVDGDTSDWSGVPAYAADLSGDSTGAGGLPDWTTLYLANDDEYLYVRLVLTGGAAMQGPGGYELYFDTDDNAATGFALSNFGSELLLQNGGLFQQRDGGFNEGGVTGGGFLVAPSASSAAAEYEFRLARTATFSSDSGSVFSASAVHVYANLFDAGFASLDVMPDLTSGGAPAYGFASAPMASVGLWKLR